MKNLGLAGYLKGQGQVLGSLAGTAAVWGLVIVGAGGGVAAYLRPTPKPPKVTIPAPTVGPEGVAELYVAAWLRADRDHTDELSAYYPAAVDFRDITNVAGVKVSRTATVEAKEVEPDYWSVTVAAEIVTDPTVPSTHFYRVPMVRNGPVYVGASLPFEVSAPLGARAPYLAGESLHRPNAGDPIAATVGQFLGALLAGQGDLTRFVSPHLSIAAVRPPPYASVAVRQIAQRNLPGGNREVLAEAVGTDSSGVGHVLQYPLEMAERAGRWEVAQMLSAPTLSSEQPSLPAPTTLPPAPVTTSGGPTTTTSIRPTVPTSRPAI